MAGRLLYGQIDWSTDSVTAGVSILARSFRPQAPSGSTAPAFRMVI